MKLSRRQTGAFCVGGWWLESSDSIVSSSAGLVPVCVRKVQQQSLKVVPSVLDCLSALDRVLERYHLIPSFSSQLEEQVFSPNRHRLLGLLAVETIFNRGQKQFLNFCAGSFEESFRLKAHRRVERPSNGPNWLQQSCCGADVKTDLTATCRRSAFVLVKKNIRVSVEDGVQRVGQVQVSPERNQRLGRRRRLQLGSVVRKQLQPGIWHLLFPEASKIQANLSLG